MVCYCAYLRIIWRRWLYLRLYSVVRKMISEQRISKTAEEVGGA
jgi:hypothetical protein